MLRYWPLLAIVVVLVSIIGMSQYADSSKHHYGASAAQTETASVAKGDDAKTSNNAEEAYKPPVWAKYVAWPEGIGVWVVLLTLFVIAWQSVETHAAAKATQDSARATAEQSANMMAQERAVLSIICPSMEPQIDAIKIEDVDGTISQFLELYIDVINDGESNAFNVTASGYVMIEVIDSGKPYASRGAELAIPKVIRDANTVNPVRVHLGPSGIGDSVLILSSEWQDVQSGDKPLHIVGTISYNDVFGKPHNTPFWYTWKIRRGSDGWGDEAEWTDHSGASD